MSMDNVGGVLHDIKRTIVLSKAVTFVFEQYNQIYRLLTDAGTHIRKHSIKRSQEINLQ